MVDLINICQAVARILGGKGSAENDKCSVSVDRKSLEVKILGKKFEPEHEFTFINLKENHALCLGEMVLLEGEVQFIVAGMSQQGILVTAIHNHWLFDEPKLIYMHIEAVMNPIDFATRVANVINYLK